MILNEGIDELILLITGAGGTPYNNANTRIGIGDSSTAANASQTGLQAASNKAWVGMAATYPTTSGQTLTFRAVFDGSTANYAWNEVTVVNAANDTGKNLIRSVISQGTKIAGQVWTLDVPFTLG